VSTADAAAPAEDPKPSGDGKAQAPQLVPAVLKYGNRLYGFLKNLDRDELAQRMADEAMRWKEDRTSIVVAGEIKRGKTSFINAVLGQSQLLPVDADVATSVHLAVGYAPQLVIRVTKSIDDEVDQFTIRPDQLVDYGSMLGDPAKREGVEVIEVGLPHPLLERGLVLIDTPGVGGLTPGHRDIALSALGRADALVFTVSSQEPVLRSELDFLAEASERIDEVLFVLTKVDANADWARMLDENRDKMRQYLTQLQGRAHGPEATEHDKEIVRRFPRLLEDPFIPVSARMAERARARAEAGRVEQAAELHARSGFAPIEVELDRILRSREYVRLNNILRLGSSLLSRVEEEANQRIRIIDGDHTVQQEMADKQALLEDLVSKQSRWRQRFAGSVQRIQTETNRRVGRELGQIERTYRQILNEHKPEELADTLPEELERSVYAAWLNLTGFMIAGFDEALTELMGSLEVEGLDVELAQMSVPGDMQIIGMRDRTNAEVGKGSFLDDGLPLITSASIFSSMITKAIGASAMGGMGMMFLPGLLVAGPVAYLRSKKRKSMQQRAEYLRVMKELLVEVRQEFQSELSLKVLDVREKLETMIDEALGNRRKELELQRKDLAGLLKEDTARRAQLRAEAKELVQKVQAHRAEADKLRVAVDRASQAALAAAPRAAASAAATDVAASAAAAPATT
jgi:hypothetical protein